MGILRRLINGYKSKNINDKDEKTTLNIQHVVPFKLNENSDVMSRTILVVFQKNILGQGVFQFFSLALGAKYWASATTNSSKGLTFRFSQTFMSPSNRI